MLTWVRRLQRFCPLASISMELVKFDTHLMDHPEVSGIEYCQGTLYGHEVRAYLLEKWGARLHVLRRKERPASGRTYDPTSKRREQPYQ